jgi:hypothetical protein
MSLRDMFKGIALLACLSFALVACGGDAVSPGTDGPAAEPPIVAAPDPADDPTENPIEQPVEPDPLPPPPEGTPLPPPSSVVLSIVSEGGFVPVERALGRLPTMVVYEDGTIVQPGPVPEIYPGSLLKPLEAGQLAESELAPLLEQIRKARVFGSDIDFGFPGVTDLDSTTIEVVLDGEQRLATAYALYEEFADDPALTPSQADARAELMSIVSAAFAAAASVTEWTEPGVSDIVVWALPYFAPQDIDPGPEIDWPLATDAISVDPGLERGCVELAGADANLVLEAARPATQLSPWRIGAERYTLVIRPRLLQQDRCEP